MKILHLGQGSFTRKVRTIFTLKIIVSIFVKLFLILVLHLRQFFIVRIFVKRATGDYTEWITGSFVSKAKEGHVRILTISNKASGYPSGMSNIKCNTCQLHSVSK